MNLTAWLIGMVGPVVARLLVSLGLSAVTLTGLSLAAVTLQTTLVTSLHSLPAKAIQLGGLMGLWEAVGMYLGAVAFVVAWKAASGAWTFAKT